MTTTSSTLRSMALSRRKWKRLCMRTATPRRSCGLAVAESASYAGRFSGRHAQVGICSLSLRRIPNVPRGEP